MALLMNLRLRTKLFASFGVVCALMLLLAALFFHKLDRAETANARTVHTHEFLDALDAVLLGMVNQETALRGFLLSGEERFLDTYRRGVGLVDTNLAFLEEWTAEDARARALVEDVRTAALDWRRDHAERAMALRRDPATAQAATALETSGAGKAQMDAIRRMIADFSAAEGDLLAQRARELTAALDSGRLMAVGGVAIALVLALLCGFFLYASTSRPMLVATNALERLGEGQTEVVIPRTSRTDEIGRLVTAAHNLRGFVRRSIAQAQMIEEMPTAVMVADPEDDFRIAYVNRASRALFERLEAATGIRAAEIEGSSIDIFHTDPARQRQLLSDPSNLPHTTTITIGPEKVLLRVTAIRNAAGRYVSPMLTWHVITEKERMASNFETNVKQSVDRLTVAFDDVREKMRAVVAEARATEAESSSVAAAMEEANQSVQTVAAAAEELAGSIREVGDQVTRSAERSRTALGMGGDAAAKARSLSESADEIGDVVSLISDIAGQTNLLALNATIEAARAGEAGSGFAVVAREVKNLAEQTAKATEEIGAKIAQMRQATTTTVEAVATVQRLIEEVSGIFASVASAVEEQTAATAEISTAAQQAAESTQAVSESIAIVRRSSAHTGSSAETVLQKTAELTEAAAGLGQAANDFLGRVRAA